MYKISIGQFNRTKFFLKWAPLTYILSLLIVGTISKPTNFTVNFYNNDYAIKGRWKAKKDLFKQFIIYGFVNAAAE